MSQDEAYRQCTLKKGSEYTIGYIPEHAAKVGNRVEVLSLDGDFWDVVVVANQPTAKEIVKKAERQYKLFQGSTRGGGIQE